MKTFVRDTSIDTYHSEVRPTLGDRQKAVYAALCEAHERDRKPNMTNSELAAMLNWPINTITPRIFELRAAGKVVEDFKRPCRVTGRMAYAWRAAGQGSLF